MYNAKSCKIQAGTSHHAPVSTLQIPLELCLVVWQSLPCDMDLKVQVRKYNDQSISEVLLTKEVGDTPAAQNGMGSVNDLQSLPLISLPQ